MLKEPWFSAFMLGCSSVCLLLWSHSGDAVLAGLWGFNSGIWLMNLMDNLIDGQR